MLGRITHFALATPWNAMLCILGLLGFPLLLAVAGAKVVAVLLLSFMAFVGSLLSSLFILRKGWQFSSLPIAVFVGLIFLGVSLTNNQEVFFLFASVELFMLFLFASVLRATTRWSWVLGAGFIAGIVLLWMLEGLFPNIHTFWMDDVEAKLKVLMESAQVTKLSPTQMSDIIKLAIGFNMAGFVVRSVVRLLLARWWQSAIFNPGKLQAELHNIRMHPAFAGVTLLTCLASAIGVPVVNLIPIMAGIFLCAGLSVTHFWIKQRVKEKALKMGLIGVLYISLFMFPLSALTMVLLSLLGLVDSVMNLRPRMKTA